MSYSAEDPITEITSRFTALETSTADRFKELGEKLENIALAMTSLTAGSSGGATAVGAAELGTGVSLPEPAAPTAEATTTAAARSTNWNSYSWWNASERGGGWWDKGYTYDRPTHQHIDIPSWDGDHKTFRTYQWKIMNLKNQTHDSSHNYLAAQLLGKLTGVARTTCERANVDSSQWRHADGVTDYIVSSRIHWASMIWKRIPGTSRHTWPLAATRARA